MKKISVFALILLTSTSLSAQKIYSALELNKGEPQEVLYIFLTAEDKLVDELTQQHYKGFGTISNNTLSFEKEQNIHPNLTSVDIVVEHGKEYSKVSYFFFTEDKEALAGTDLDQDGANAFIYDFYDVVINAQEKEIVNSDIKVAEGDVEKAQKEIKKLKKSIERNLRDQERLGKKLDATPEELTNLIEEKNNVLQDQLELEVAIPDSTTSEKEDLGKKISKAEKAIVKKQKQSDKNAAKLVKREEQLETLTQELLDTQSLHRKLDRVLQRKKSLLLTD